MTIGDAASKSHNFICDGPTKCTVWQLACCELHAHRIPILIGFGATSERHIGETDLFSGLQLYFLGRICQYPHTYRVIQVPNAFLRPRVPT
jgi:hypothetical protein